MQELNCFPWWCASLFLWPQLYLSACVSVVGPLAIRSLRLPLVGCCGYDPFWIENANKSALATPRRRSFSNRRGSILYNNHIVKQKTIQKTKNKPTWWRWWQWSQAIPNDLNGGQCFRRCYRKSSASQSHVLHWFLRLLHHLGDFEFSCWFSVCQRWRALATFHEN